MDRFIYTFENDGTGTRIFSFFGTVDYNLPFTITNTIEEARSSKWGWTTYDFLDPEDFTWELLDDLLKVNLLEYNFEQTLNFEMKESGFVMHIQNTNITLVKG